jgi:hypothetical protein
MANTTLSDKGLVRGSRTVSINGYTYLLKTGTRDKPVKSNFEYDENGRPKSSSHVKDFEKLTGEIMAYAGTPEPEQLYPFLDDGKYWALLNLKLNYATEGLRGYSVEITQLAGTTGADFTTTTV